jgi:hypothetical protein
LEEVALAQVQCWGAVRQVAIIASLVEAVALFQILLAGVLLALTETARLQVDQHRIPA